MGGCIAYATAWLQCLYALFIVVLLLSNKLLQMIGSSTGSASNAINKTFLTVSTCFIFPQRKSLGCGPKLPSRVYVTIKILFSIVFVFNYVVSQRDCLILANMSIFLCFNQNYKSYQFPQLFTHQCRNCVLKI